MSVQTTLDISTVTLVQDFGILICSDLKCSLGVSKAIKIASMCAYQSDFTIFCF